MARKWQNKTNGRAGMDAIVQKVAKHRSVSSDARLIGLP